MRPLKNLKFGTDVRHNMPVISIQTEQFQQSYHLSPDATLRDLIPLVAEELGEADDTIQLHLHGNRIYPETPLIPEQTYDVTIVPVERILLRARKQGNEWCVEQANGMKLTQCANKACKYQIRHSEELRYYYMVQSFSAWMTQLGFASPTLEEVERFVESRVEFLPGDYVAPW